MDYSSLLLQLAVTPDQIVRGTIILQSWRRFAFKFGNDPLGQHLAEFHAPLIKRIKIPDDALREHDVLIKRHEIAENFGRQSVGENYVRRTIALENAMRHQPGGSAFSFDFGGSFPKRQRLGLRENI